jgi:hypothetical protein
MTTEILVADLRQEVWFRDNLAPSFAHCWERAVSAVEQPDWMYASRVDSADLALCLYLSAIMPDDIEPTDFLTRMRSEGVPYSDVLGSTILEYIDNLICNEGFAARVLHIDVSSFGTEVVQLAEDPEMRCLYFTLEHVTPDPKSLYSITRIPQSVLQHLAELTRYGFPIHNRE